MDAKQNIKDAQINLIKELGIDKLEKEPQEKMLLQMNEVIQQRVILRIVETLTEEEKDQFTKLLENQEKEPEKVSEFLKAREDQLDQITLEEIGKYKREMLEFVRRNEENLTNDNQPEAPEERSDKQEDSPENGR